MFGDKQRVIGIDPGLCRSGIGVVECSGNHLRYIFHDVIKTRAQESHDVRLAKIFRGISDIIHKYEPNAAAVEAIFVNKNPGTSLKLEMARGVCICAPAMCGLSVYEYSANKIKKSVTGHGHATKDSIAYMVSHLLCHDGLKADAADAMAVAITHIYHSTNHARY